MKEVAADLVPSTGSGIVAVKVIVYTPTCDANVGSKMKLLIEPLKAIHDGREIEPIEV